ncbi:hypothetical protein [Mycobacterium phage Weirdo19]|uniref:Uncharacterized protein n=1 Tax=Mycobacterium phage Weirdo19 TaxID=2601610 RepID=A0A6M2YT01_9CAUD|nr:hypothetical protein KDJ11_gp62 [Mycobacterium phage Weirdo19]QEA10830.1 hypothetical protein [Mycobacterium phage Weirdo19]
MVHPHELGVIAPRFASRPAAVILAVLLACLAHLAASRWA